MNAIDVILRVLPVLACPLVMGGAMWFLLRGQNGNGNKSNDTQQVRQVVLSNEPPKSAPHNWQRGIALYYAGKFTEGRKQFELHQTVNPDDVENAVWHFLCTAREQGVEAARKQLIPIRGDTRIPMKEIHDLFAAKATPEDVLAAAAAGDATPADRRNRTFYAHLYLGLYFEALGDAARMREHILASLPLAAPDDYMGDVARVHARRLTAEPSPKSK